MNARLDRLEECVLPVVSKPGRYVPPHGLSTCPDFEAAPVRLCLVLPEPWESGICRPRLQTLLQSLAAQGHPGDPPLVDLVFDPDPDCRLALTDRGLPLFGLRSRRPLREFDLVVAFPDRLLDGGVLGGMLEAGGVAPRALDRHAGVIVLTAGPMASAPGPLLPLAEGFLVGDPEAFATDLVAFFTRARSEGWKRSETLFRLAELPGVLVPDRIAVGRASGSAESPTPVAPRWLSRLPSPDAEFLAPLSETPAGGLVFELTRRRDFGEGDLLARTFDSFVGEVEHAVAHTGCGEVILAGDEPGRYPDLVPLLETLNQRLSAHDAHVRLQEVDAARMEPALARELRKAHRAELVFAPVATSERLREVVGRPLSRDDLMSAIDVAARGGWSALRLRVILGLSGETPEDRDEWCGLLEELAARLKKRSPAPRLTLEVVPDRFRTGGDTGHVPDPGVWEETVPRWRRRLRKHRIRIIGASISEVLEEATLRRSALRFPLDPNAPGTETGSRADAQDGVAGSAPGRGPLPGFGPPPWAGGRRPKRASRARDTLQAERFRLRFSKDEPMRFFSHLDVTRAFLRAFRKGQLPVAQSGGKDRRPRISFGPPLPLGMTSGAEYLDVTFQREVPESFVRSLNEALPEGLSVVACAPVRTEPDSLNSAIQLAAYEVSFPDTVIQDFLDGIDFDDLRIRLQGRLTGALASDTFEVTRVRGEVSRTFNARPSLIRAEVVRDDGGRPALSTTLTLNRPVSVRPELFVSTLVDWAHLDERLLRVHRSGLSIPGRKKDLDPLEVVAPGFRWWRQPVRKGTVL